MTKRKHPHAKHPMKTGPKDNWKMTPETIVKLEGAFAIDCTVGEACAFADINTDTYYRWIKEHPELSDKFERLQNNPILRAKSELFKVLKDNPELCLKLLERKLPKQYGPQIKLDGKIDVQSLHLEVVKLINGLEIERKQAIDVSRETIPEIIPEVTNDD